MVYESDFYTTRRPYTRPISTSYTVTDPGLRPISPAYRPTSPSIRSITPTTQVKRIPHLLPYIAHKRLVTVVHTPVHSYYYPGTPVPIRIHSRVRPSVLAAELQRIRDLPRSSHRSYTSSYLSSRPNVLWDDETREIRARADALLRRIHVFVPRPLTSDFAEDIIPERMQSDDYIRRVIGARKNAKKDEDATSYYDSPDQRHFGTGNLACVSYTGGKPHSRRRPYYKLADLRPADVQSDVNLLSYYAKNRQAAASAYPDPPVTEREIRKARALENDEEQPRPNKRAMKQEPEPIYERELETVYEPETEVAPSKFSRTLIPEAEPRRIMKPEAERFIEPEPETFFKAEPEVTREPEVTNEPEVTKEPEVTEEPEVAKEPEVTEEPEATLVSEAVPIAEVEPEAIEEPQARSIIEKEQEAETVEQAPETIADYVPEVTAEGETVRMIVETEIVPEVETQPEVHEEPLLDEKPVSNEEPEVEETVAPSETEMKETAVESMEDAGDSASMIAERNDNADVETANVDAEDEDAGEDVLQRKLDEEELRRQVEELKRQAEAEERRLAEEARLAEERWKMEEEERRRREKEEQERRLAEIEEQERLEAERKIEEERWEAERIRDAKLAEIEKRAAEFDALLATEEEERYAIEKANEEARKRQEREERLAAEVILGTAEDLHHPDGSYNECHCHPDVNSQELEERPESPDAEDDTQIEEEECGGETDHDDTTDPFIVEHEGFNSAPADVVDAIDDGAIVEESDTNVDNFWADSDA